MFGTNITVEFNSAWFVNEVEEDLALDQKAAETDALENAAEVSEVEGSDGKLTEVSEEVTPEGETEETDVQADAEQMPEEETPEEENAPEENAIVTAIETAAETIADAIEGETKEDEETKDGDE